VKADSGSAETGISTSLVKLLQEPFIIREGVLQLHGPLWGIPGKQEFLLERPSYDGFLKAIKEFLNDPRRTLVALGSKGIGKSCSTYFLLPFLVNLGHIVTYEDADIKLIIVGPNPKLEVLKEVNTVLKDYRIHSLSPEQGVYEVGASQFDAWNHLKNLQNLICVHDLGVSDDNKLTNKAAKQIVISSPNSGRLKILLDTDDSMTYLFEEWSLEECFTFSKSFHPNAKVSEDEIERRFNMIGGKIRYLFDLNFYDKLAGAIRVDFCKS
jgi:hypothetical protein